MEKDIRKNWDHAMRVLMELPKERREHFALLLVNLAKCYVPDNNWKAVILIDNEDSMLTFSAGADDMEAAEMLNLACETVNAVNMVDAPPKEMMN